VTYVTMLKMHSIGTLNHALKQSIREKKVSVDSIHLMVYL